MVEEPVNIPTDGICPPPPIKMWKPNQINKKVNTVGSIVIGQRNQEVWKWGWVCCSLTEWWLSVYVQGPGFSHQHGKIKVKTKASRVGCTLGIKHLEIDLQAESGKPFTGVASSCLVSREAQQVAIRKASSCLGPRWRGHVWASWPHPGTRERVLTCHLLVVPGEGAVTGCVWEISTTWVRLGDPAYPCPLLALGWNMLNLSLDILICKMGIDMPTS